MWRRKKKKEWSDHTPPVWVWLLVIALTSQYFATVPDQHDAHASLTFKTSENFASEWRYNIINRQLANADVTRRHHVWLSAMTTSLVEGDIETTRSAREKQVFSLHSLMEQVRPVTLPKCTQGACLWQIPCAPSPLCPISHDPTGGPLGMRALEEHSQCLRTIPNTIFTDTCIPTEPRLPVRGGNCSHCVQFHYPGRQRPGH